ncbi:MAG: LysR family transcriptional regulator [Alphaproteobacteria bacterium]|nr:LysR family transcriptional regulator [Alphaproteobacteria bacterium]
MASSDPHWNELRTFVEVARDGSLSAAARRLGLTQPTVGRHIDTLEASLGLTLFTRSSRGLTPTAAAVALVPHAQAMAVAAAAFGRTASGEAASDRGTVRLTASEVVGYEVLPAILAAFRRDHPDIAIELVLTNRTEDLARRDADIAVRMVRPTQSGLVARRIGTSRLALYAHRDYLARFGEPRSLADLASHCVIGFDRDNRSFRSAGSFAKQLTRDDFGFRCDSDLAQIAALRAGVGIGGCQENIARRTPELVQVLPNAFHHALEVWLLMHEDLKMTRRVRLLFDHLAAGLTGFVKGRL